MSSNNDSAITAGGVATVIVGIFLLIGLCVGMAFGCAGYNRYQARADNANHRKIARLNAQNQVFVSNIQIRNQAQRVKIAQQQAQIRYQRSVGIRKAQDEIAKTLTPLYVAFEMTQALQQIAETGRNNSVIYIPTNPATGLPIVPTSNSKSP